MARILQREIREVLVILKDTDFIVTGSVALKVLGHLDREVKDLDLISNDSRVLDILKLHCTDLSEVMSDPFHYRFMFESLETLYIDVFTTEYFYTTQEIIVDGLKLRLTPSEFVLKTKLKKFNSDQKTIEDLLCYFKSKLLNINN